MRLGKSCFYDALSLEECETADLSVEGAKFDVTMSIRCHLLAHREGLKELSKQVDDMYKEAFKKK
jgi:hypothetical protein